MLQTVATQTEPKVMNASAERAIAEWQQLYPDQWLLLEVIQEDEGEPMGGRLMAVVRWYGSGADRCSLALFLTVWEQTSGNKAPYTE